MLRNHPNTYSTAGRNHGGSRYGDADPMSDLSNRLDELSNRLGQINGGAPARRDTSAARELSDIAETVDRLVDQIGQKNHRSRPSKNGSARGLATPQGGHDRLGSILSTLDGIDRRVQNMSGRQQPEENDTLRHAIDEITKRQQSLDLPTAAKAAYDAQPQVAMIDVEHHFKSLAEKIDSLRQDDTEAAIDRLRREIGSLRTEFERREPLGLSESDTAMVREIGQKVQDLSSSQTDPQTVEALRDEIAELRQSVISNNVEGTLHSLESGYQHIVERLDEMRRTIGDPRLLVRLADRIDTIDGALKTIPQVEQINALDQRVSSLSRQIDGLSLDMNDPGVAQIEHQLAEMRSALGGVDTSQAVATLEDQLGALHDKIDNLGHSGSLENAPQDSESLMQLSHQIDEMRAAMAGEREIDRFGHLDASITEMSRKLDALESMRTDNDGMAQLEHRIDGVIARLEDIVPSAPDGNAFAALESRIADIANKLDSFDRMPPSADTQALGALEETVQRIDEALRSTAEGDALNQLDDRVANLASQIDDLNAKPLDISEMADLRDEIASMRNAFSKPIPVDLSKLERQIHALNDTVSAPQGTIDPGALMQLEDQVSHLAQQIDGNGDQSEALSAIESALAHIHNRLDDGRGEAAAAAREAAREALSSFAGEQTGSAGQDAQFRAVQEDLTRLQSVAHESAERTQDTLIALHETMQAMSSRLSHLETGGSAPATPAAQPTQAPAYHNPTATEAQNHSPEPRNDPIGVVEQRLATVAGALSKSAEQPRRDAPNAETPPSVYNEDTRPLEPGTGRPDPVQLASRDTKNHGSQGNPGDTTARDRKADFIAAARRAAQAAASDGANQQESATKKRRNWFRRPGKSEMAQEPVFAEPKIDADTSNPTDDLYATPLAGSQEPPSASGFGGIIQKHKRPLMIAAAGLIIVFGGFQAAKLFLAPASTNVAYQEQAQPAPTATKTPAERPGITPVEPVASEKPSGTAAPDVAPAGSGASAVDTEEPRSYSGVDNNTTSSTESNTPAMPATADVNATTPAISGSAPPNGTATANAPTQMPPEQVGSLTLRKAAADGNAAAQFEVAARFTEGRGVKPNLSIAAQWYERAASHGLPQAQYRLGSLYEKGTGVQKNIDTARDWYGKAAEQGNTKAMHNLAVLYAEGIAGAPDFTTASKWFIKAANTGVRDSQYNLGILHARGLGVTQDLKNSYKWFALAAKQGDSDAGKKRDEIANALDRKGLAAARLAVETWQPAPALPSANGKVPMEAAWGNTPDRSAAVSPAIATQPASPVSAPPAPSRRDVVQRAQAILSQLGYNPGPADGVSGPRTRDAVMDFQRKAGLPMTGNIDTNLVSALSKQAI